MEIEEIIRVLRLHSNPFYHEVADALEKLSNAEPEHTEKQDPWREFVARRFERVE
jgi:DNA replication initiation complex subunit (GINS family)